MQKNIWYAGEPVKTLNLSRAKSLGCGWMMVTKLEGRLAEAEKKIKVMAANIFR